MPDEKNNNPSSSSTGVTPPQSGAVPGREVEPTTSTADPAESTDNSREGRTAGEGNQDETLGIP